MIQQKGAMDIHKVIGYLPHPKKGWVLPSHKYTGPYNPLDKQLSNDIPVSGQEPFNNVDEISLRHDICYRDKPSEKNKCDKIMLNELKLLQPKDKREKLDKFIVSNVIGAKNKLGLGIKWTNKLATELHKPIRKNFTKRYVFARNVDDIWAADLIDLRSHSKVNGGYKYVLMVIDVFSKYGWAIPLKFKTGVAVTEALKTLFEENKPKKLWVDRGGEFYNKSLEPILKNEGIQIYSTHNDEKCSVVERWNRTIKTNLWKYFTANGTYKYTDILQALIQKYNNTVNRSTKFTPVNARKSINYHEVFHNLFSKKLHKSNTTPIFIVGDKVRITRKKHLFDKGYTSNWTNKVYTISKVLPTRPPTYKIKTDREEELEGSFYEQELQKSKEDYFQIEKILGWKNIKGKKHGRVKWLGYDNSYNTWEPEDHIKDMKDI